MPKTVLKCRVCGKEYEPCRTAIRTPGVFHWQEVACSPECGAVYLQRITESRQPAEAAQARKNRRKKKSVHVEAAPAASEPSPTTAGAAPVEAGVRAFDMPAE